MALISSAKARSRRSRPSTGNCLGTLLRWTGIQRYRQRAVRDYGRRLTWRLRDAIDRRELSEIDVSNFHAFFFSQHLYEPLIYLNSDLVEVRPVHLNEGERDFVIDLRTFYQENREFFKSKELYLLRNMSRG